MRVASGCCCWCVQRECKSESRLWGGVPHALASGQQPNLCLSAESPDSHVRCEPQRTPTHTFEELVGLLLELIRGGCRGISCCCWCRHRDTRCDGCWAGWEEDNGCCRARATAPGRILLAADQTAKLVMWAAAEPPTLCARWLAWTACCFRLVALAVRPWGRLQGCDSTAQWKFSGLEG